MQAETVLEELTQDDLTQDHVRRRVDDWAARIENLYKSVEEWWPSGWTVRRGAPEIMDEQVMQIAAEPPRELPTLELLRDGVVAIRLRPYGLWIIGTNGRLDLVKGIHTTHFIYDDAKLFGPPIWRIVARTDRQNGKPFDRQWLETLLAS